MQITHNSSDIQNSPNSQNTEDTQITQIASDTQILEGLQTEQPNDDRSEQSPGERSSTQSSSTHDTSEHPPATDHDAQSVGTDPTLINQDPAATVGNTSMQQPPQES